MILLIDNYDSFTYNLYHYLMEVGAKVSVIRNDAVSVEDVKGMNIDGIVLSPGPCTPNEAGVCLDIVDRLHDVYPILGVCLGHQSIAQSFGAKIVRGDRPMHAVISMIKHEHSSLFAGVPESFRSTRYHSLVIKPDTMPDCLRVTAVSDDGVIQAIEHKKYPVYGVQFHPESIASEKGRDILRNFKQICEKK